MNCANRCQPIPIRPILRSPRQLDPCAGDPLEADFEERAVMDFKQSISDMNPEIDIDADQVGIERRMVDLGEREAI